MFPTVTRQRTPLATSYHHDHLSNGCGDVSCGGSHRRVLYALDGAARVPTVNGRLVDSVPRTLHRVSHLSAVARSDMATTETGGDVCVSPGNEDLSTRVCCERQKRTKSRSPSCVPSRYGPNRNNLRHCEAFQRERGLCPGSGITVIGREVKEEVLMAGLVMVGRRGRTAGLRVEVGSQPTAENEAALRASATRCDVTSSHARHHGLDSCLSPRALSDLSFDMRPPSLPAPHSMLLQDGTRQ